MGKKNRKQIDQVDGTEMKQYWEKLLEWKREHNKKAE